MRVGNCRDGESLVRFLSSLGCAGDEVGFIFFSFFPRVPHMLINRTCCLATHTFTNTQTSPVAQSASSTWQGHLHWIFAKDVPLSTPKMLQLNLGPASDIVGVRELAIQLGRQVLYVVNNHRHLTSVLMDFKYYDDAEARGQVVPSGRYQFGKRLDDAGNQPSGYYRSGGPGGRGGHYGGGRKHNQPHQHRSNQQQSFAHQQQGGPPSGQQQGNQQSGDGQQLLTQGATDSPHPGSRQGGGGPSKQSSHGGGRSSRPRGQGGRGGGGDRSGGGGNRGPPAPRRFIEGADGERVELQAKTYTIEIQVKEKQGKKKKGSGDQAQHDTEAEADAEPEGAAAAGGSDAVPAAGNGDDAQKEDPSSAEKSPVSEGAVAKED